MFSSLMPLHFIYDTRLWMVNACVCRYKSTFQKSQSFWNPLENTWVISFLSCSASWRRKFLCKHIHYSFKTWEKWFEFWICIGVEALIISCFTVACSLPRTYVKLQKKLLPLFGLILFLLDKKFMNWLNVTFWRNLVWSRLWSRFTMVIISTDWTQRKCRLLEFIYHFWSCCIVHISQYIAVTKLSVRIV